MITYLQHFSFPSRKDEADFIKKQPWSCYDSYYPFGVFEARSFREGFHFSPITIFYGTNGSGKSTALNVIAEYLRINHLSVFNTTKFMPEYLKLCKCEHKTIPHRSAIITSDDVFNFLTDVRYRNLGIDARREDLFEEFYNRRKPMRLHSIDDYDNYKKHVDATRRSSSDFIKSTLLSNVRTESNGESALKFFFQKITENALFLLDEPENSLAPKNQLLLKEYIEQSARGCRCQFIIATHSPFLLTLEDATIYNLDTEYGEQTHWTKLENIRLYYEFFKSHAEEFPEE